VLGANADPRLGLDVSRWGLVQLEGGPCGVLAVVIAQLAIELGYRPAAAAAAGDDADTAAGGADAAASQQTGTGNIDRGPRWFQRALGGAIAEILCRAAPDGESVQLAVPSDAFDPATLAGVRLIEARGRADAARAVEANLAAFTSTSGGTGGIPLLIASAVMSRGGPAMVSSDFDQLSEASLIGRHGYCTQELVNLLLTGRATSNVFDGSRELDDGAVHLLGVLPRRCDAGYLTLYEHYGSMEVGDRLKTPRFPVWVVCAESHFSVLLASTTPGSAWPAVSAEDWGGPPNSKIREDRRLSPTLTFDYYDQLARPPVGEGVVLTVTRNGAQTASSRYTEEASDAARLVPPINHVIGTRWRGADIQWSCDPHL
jgi:hypothetical protein